MDLSMVSGAINGAITASGNRAIARIQAEASNNIRAINNQTVGVVNKRNAAITSLQRWAQSVRNSRVYESVAEHQSALVTNFNRARDTRTRQNFAANVQEAEEQGRFAAAAAASGITGSVVDIIDTTAQLRTNLKDAARKESEKQIGYDFNQQQNDQREALLDNLDYSLILDNPQVLDSQITQATQTPGVLSSAIAGMGTGGLQSIATGLGNFFSTPKGGSDTLSAFLTLNDNYSSKEV